MKTMKTRLTQLDRIIRDHHTNPAFSVERMTELLHISSSYLREIVYRERHTHPNELIELYRLNRARQLLHDPAIPIQEVSLRVGYWNPKTFRSAFRKRFGTSPSEYRDETFAHTPKSGCE